MQLNALLNPLKLSTAIGLVGFLAGCTGNSSTTVSGPGSVIDPIVIDKTIAEVTWTPENYVTNASHAYRVITKNSMVRTVFTNQLPALDLVVNLTQVTSERDCKVSGRMIAEAKDDKCFNAEETLEDCTDDSPIRERTQESQGIACQDGIDSGKYFDGFFNITKRTDVVLDTETRTSTTFSSIGEALTYDENGDLIEDEDGPVLVELTDYLFQSDFSIFFIDNEYESYVNFSSTKFTCGTKIFDQVVQQGMRSTRIGAQEGDGTNNFYLYTEFTGLELDATPAYECDELTEKVTTNYSYNLVTTLANAAMGGGTDRNTEATWSDMGLSLKGTPSGTLELEHGNAAGPYGTVTVTFVVDIDAEGNEEVTVNITDTNTSTAEPLADFLARSEPITPAE